jgi:hypothetical protein
MPNRAAILIIALGLLALIGVWMAMRPATGLAPGPTGLSENFEDLGPLRSGECRVYYTKNVDICDRPNADITNPNELITKVDANALNFYSLGKNEMESQKTRLETIAANARTASQNSALGDLKRALADLDSFPFKNTCKLEMANLVEVASHPMKINQDYDAGRRGDPLHWAFCYYPTANDALASNRITAERKNSPEFKRVFKDSQVEDRYNNQTYHRYDMASLYNDDLLNLHCALYTDRVLNGGGQTSAFQGTRFMEWTLDAGAVMNKDRTLTIRRMRPVKIENNLLVLESSPVEKKKSYLSLLQLIRTADSLVHRQAKYSPTIYKFLFHLCSAPPPAPAAASVITSGERISNQLIQLVVPKTFGKDAQALFKLLPSDTRSIYNFITNRPYGDISDMVFNLSNLDSLIQI